jgi:diguanylate cyclase (GGDEF)-like protein
VELPAPAEFSSQSMGPSTEIISRPASAVAERISMALANLRLRDVLRDQSIRDPLTGLFNRRYMEATLERELRRAARDNQSLAFLMIDIDHFKMFNDTFGHQAGDILLRAVGEFLGHGTREEDVACRFGGEEFVLILADTSLEIAYRRAEVLREELARLAVQHKGQTLGKITMSVGIAAFPEHGTSSEELIRKSDTALYKAKEDGRDRTETA